MTTDQRLTKTPSKRLWMFTEPFKTPNEERTNQGGDMVHGISSVLSNVGLARVTSPIISRSSLAVDVANAPAPSSRILPQTGSSARPHVGVFDSKWALALGFCLGLAGCAGDDNVVINPAPLTCLPADGGASDATIDAGDAGVDALPPCPDNSDNPPYDPNNPGCSDDYCPSGQTSNP